MEFSEGIIHDKMAGQYSNTTGEEVEQNRLYQGKVIKCTNGIKPTNATTRPHTKAESPQKAASEECPEPLSDFSGSIIVLLGLSAAQSDNSTTMSMGR
jgi:hypothetical protein